MAKQEDGKGGAEIWMPVFTREPKTVQVYHADSKILLLQAHYQGVPLLLCSAHAPHTGRAMEHIAEFWDRLQMLVRKFH